MTDSSIRSAVVCFALSGLNAAAGILFIFNGDAVGFVNLASSMFCFGVGWVLLQGGDGE